MESSWAHKVLLPLSARICRHYLLNCVLENENWWAESGSKRAHVLLNGEVGKLCMDASCDFDLNVPFFDIISEKYIMESCDIKSSRMFGDSVCDRRI